MLARDREELMEKARAAGLESEVQGMIEALPNPRIHSAADKRRIEAFIFRTTRDRALERRGANLRIVPRRPVFPQGPSWGLSQNR